MGQNAHGVEPDRELWVQAHDLSIRYDEGTTVLSDVDFSLHRGESILLIGPSGCGKSTLAMLCAGLIPKVVEAKVDGEWFAHSRLSSPGGVGYVFQDPDAQFCMLSVADEVAFGLENLGRAQEDMDDAMEQSLSVAGLSANPEELRRAHSSFSGGMKQKLGIACALAMDAELLVLDEPTANLDPLSTRQVFLQIADLHRRGQTMLIIEHKFSALVPYVDTVVLFGRDGRIHRQGPSAKVLLEEWDWLIREGIVAPWKEPPSFSKGESIGQHRSHPMARRLTRKGSSANHDAAISLVGASAQYGKGLPVWSDVTLDIPKGSITAIVGPNGCGKTTLLQVMAGLKQPASGQIWHLGELSSRTKRKRQAPSISYCFQNPEFQFIFERVVDELMNQAGVEKGTDAVNDLMARFGLTKVADQSPYALSQGQKRRLSVATMLRQPHELYFLDEPTFGQDASTQAAIMEELLRLFDLGKTIVLTTHDMDLVRQYATHVIVIANGGVTFTGEAHELFARPDIMTEAHLLDDLALPQEDLAAPLDDLALPFGDIAMSADDRPLSFDTTPAASLTASRASLVSADREDKTSQGRESVHSDHPEPVLVREPRSLQARSPLVGLNPAWHLVAVFVAVVLTIGAHTVQEAALIFALPIVLMLGLLWMNPWRLLRRYSIFLLFYVFYLGSYMAYTRIPPGTVHVIHILWLHADWYGFRAGLILALRMLGAVGLGLTFLSATDLTVFASALSQSMRVPPKFSYGLMAGAHFMPLFQEEWKKLRLARRLRGKEGRFWSRPVLYALPILSQAIRMSERVAIAMEARGFVGEAAANARRRTYYRRIRVGFIDILYDVLMPTVIALILIFVR